MDDGRNERDDRGGANDDADLLAAAEALLAAKDDQMETRAEWDALRRAVERQRQRAANP